jgi:hypothetical protein
LIASTAILTGCIAVCTMAVIETIKQSKMQESDTEEWDHGLVELRDKGILSNSELEEIIEIYEKKDIEKADEEQYQRYARLLYELRETGYFTDEEYSLRLDRLKRYFKMD